MENKIISILSDLVGIDSVNLTLANGPGEIEIAEFVHQYLHRLGLDAEIQIVAPGRANVVCILSGTIRNRSILLNAHLDTVGVENMQDPFVLKQQGDKLFGRGAYDMKGSAALMLLLAEYLVQERPPIDVYLTFVADEEDKSIGMTHLVDKWLPQISPLPMGAIVLEPTELQIGVGHKGFTWYEIEIIGKAAHGSRPAEGVDAILPLRAALDEINNIQTELYNRPADHLLGHATVHSSLIEGGSELSVIPARSKLLWERRSLPEESQQDLSGELKRILAAVENHPGAHTVKGQELFVRPPYRVSDKAEVLKCLQSASPQSKPVGLSFWADSALCAKAEIPSVLFGPVGHGAHAVDEWVSLKSLAKVYAVLNKMIFGIQT
jgi:acetylornithine deacetylase